MDVLRVAVIPLVTSLSPLCLKPKRLALSNSLILLRDSLPNLLTSNLLKPFGIYDVASQRC
jgi:hypothetical protein